MTERLNKLNKFPGYDLIGDIHGHADALRNLLAKLGYQQADGVFTHSDRKVIFLGDFIDRGPKIREVIDIARSMVESGQALAVMGNHEFNALAFHTTLPNRPDQSLRPRTSKNIRQHVATLSQLKDGELADALEWFRRLPMQLEVRHGSGSVCRAVHACWDDHQLAIIEQASRLCSGFDTRFLADACSHGTSLFDAVEIVLKGKEAKLPSGHSFVDKDGHRRTAIRTRWFAEPGVNYQEYALQSDPIDCPIPLPADVLATATSYAVDAPPVFCGHYWLSASSPSRLAPNVACLDYSVAKGGFLCAYKWDGESEIDDSKFVWTN